MAACRGGAEFVDETEELIELCVEGITPTEQRDQPFGILLDVEGISPGVDFRKIIPASLSSA